MSEQWECLCRTDENGDPLDEVEVMPVAELDPIVAAIEAESKRLAASEREAEKNRRLMRLAGELRAFSSTTRSNVNSPTGGDDG